MNDQDAIARMVFLAKEKLSLEAHRKAMKIAEDQARSDKSDAEKRIKAARNSIQKTINLHCAINGEQAGLKQMMTSESFAEAVRQIQEQKNRMKVIKHENKVELVPESEFEKECLKQLSSGTIYAYWTDNWNKTGNFILEKPTHDWGT